jgi:RNA methyltransferase, TrmH family
MSSPYAVRMHADQPAWAQPLRQWRAVAAGPDAVLLDGFHAIKHALRFDARVPVVLAEDRDAVLRLAAELADDLLPVLSARVVTAPSQVLRELTPRVHPTGVAGIAIRPDAAATEAVLRTLPRSAPVVLLDQPRNLGNVGAVIRVAAGFGATGVVTTGDLDPWHPNVVRGSAGLHFATVVRQVDLATLPAGPLYALDPLGEDIREVEFPDDAVLAFGSERHGISEPVRALADRLVAIPMRPQVSSFNLATSVAMGLFHWMAAGRHSVIATPEDYRLS